MIRIFHPPTYGAERRYIYDVLLRHFLGIEYKAEAQERSDVRIVLAGDSVEKELRVPDVLFRTPRDIWLTPSALPVQPLDSWNVNEPALISAVTSPQIPIIYGERPASDSFISVSPTLVSLGLDIFGSAFFMLTRYEEVAKQERDAIGRFPAHFSLAYQEGFLSRPIINEYLEILWLSLTSLWPRLARRPRETRLHLSHDVDHPLYTYGQSVSRVARHVCSDIIKRKSPRLAVRRAYSINCVRRGDVDKDVYNTFDFILQTDDLLNITSTFNFICSATATAVDGNYTTDDPWIRQLMRKIHDCGHSIGLHPTYDSCHDPGRIGDEFQRLRLTCEAVGVTQEVWGGRQHYLRWCNPVTWQAWNDAGLDYDSTLSFADQPGFRCGVCYEYPVFNLKTRSPLKLYERPLIVMENTLFDYLHLPLDSAGDQILALNRICKHFNGDFTLLWHNNSLISDTERRFYGDIVRELAA